MFFHNIPDDAVLTTDQLRQYGLQFRGSHIPLDLHEEGAALVHMGQSFPREDYWIYLPETENTKLRTLTFAGHQLQRTGEDPLWRVSRNYFTMDFTQPGQWLETISIRADDSALNLIFRRYMATDDPNAEKAGDSVMITNRLTQDGEVVGVRGYREKLYIPRIVDGQTVTRIHLPYWSRSKYLRELVIEDGISQVDVDFDCETLEEISIPDSVRLAAPPVGILNTAWFRAQPPGDVYFCGYYCGTKGPGSSPVLQVREGTIGILDHAYGGDDLRQVILPESIAYIGKNAFADNKELMRILLPASARDLRDSLQIDGCRAVIYPGRSTTVRPIRKNTADLSGWDLYALGRTDKAAAALIPASCEPLAPKLTYDDGWIAHYYYSREGQDHADYLLSIRIPSGAVVHKACFMPPEHTDAPLWSKHRAPAHYYWAADYLDACTQLISRGEPTMEQLRQLEKKWIQIHPDRLKNSLYELEKEQETITGIPKRPPLPATKQLRSLILEKWKKMQSGKDGVSIDP